MRQASCESDVQRHSSRLRKTTEEAGKKTRSTTLKVPFQQAMSSWLMTPILLIAAQTLPTQQASAACVEARQAQQPACASSRAGASSSIPAAFVCGLPRTAVVARDKNRVVEGDHVSNRLRWGQQQNGRRCRPRSRGVQATMDVDGPPDVAGGDGKRSVVVREEVLRQQKEGATGGTTVEFPNVQAPTDLPQVCVYSSRE